MKLGSSVSFDGEFEDCRSLPLGFRFHPTDEELVLYYLKRKICRKRLTPKIIGETDVYKCEPCELPEKSLLQSGDRQWFFFSRRDKKYPNGSRSNRATKSGYWKATGKDRTISRNSRTVGLKKTLVFYEGRAPKGERTNWVMHEYTLDEEELKNCNAAQDSYAIYKVYHKSGSGPKNGEQYGAPFKEEEWADEDPIDDSFGNLTNEENVVPAPTCGDSVERFLDHSFCPHSTNLEDVPLQQIANVPVTRQQYPNGLTYIPEVDGDDETQSYVMESVPWEALFTEPVNVWHPCEQSDEAGGSFQITQSTTSYLQPSEALEVTSALNCLEHGTQGIEEDWSVPREAFSTEPINVWFPYEQTDEAQRSFQITQSATSDVQPFEALEVTSALNCLKQGTQRTEADFLEINDLLGPEPRSSALDSIDTNCNIPDTGEYFDAPMFFPEFNDSLGSGQALQYINGLAESDLTSQLDFHLTANFDDEDQNGPALVTSELWMHEQRFSIHSSTESNEVIMAPATNTGILYSGSSTNLNEGTQNQVRNSESWLSSTVFALLDSVPSRPAAASESALINRAFERMSSFGALRIGARDTHVAAGAGGVVVRRRESGNRGFIFLSILGVFCAVFWLLTLGTTVKVLKVFAGKFVSS